ncbi:MAG TPA: KpsF/GutQ family sugar-phosphate isomerase [Phycisphaerales bacterium]|nr:KpsF/GutQ family sugar-phosphate isomerase [Phycisphaerales bacterium]
MHTRAGRQPAEVAAGPGSPDLDFARSVIGEEATALQCLRSHLDEHFVRAVDLIVQCADAGGTVLVTGLGKSGLVGAKISATLASLGIPSHSVHPAEAAHGDLGRFRPSDLVIAISASGETDEVVNLAAILRQDAIPVVSITRGVRAEAARGRERSSLERLASVALVLGEINEAGAPDFAAPTSSTTATLALGDALALCAARRRNFSNHDFARRHPGGALGGLLRPVTEVMRWTAGKNLALIDCTLRVRDALEQAAQMGRRPGAIVLVQRSSGRLAGIFTDADLRRLVLHDPAALGKPIEDVMTRSPRTLAAGAVVRDAVRLCMEHRQDEVPIVDDAGRPLGILDVQDLIAMRLVRE